MSNSNLFLRLCLSKQQFELLIRGYKRCCNQSRHRSNNSHLSQNQLLMRVWRVTMVSRMWTIAQDTDVDQRVSLLSSIKYWDFHQVQQLIPLSSRYYHHPSSPKKGQRSVNGSRAKQSPFLKLICRMRAAQKCSNNITGHHGSTQEVN